jgi:hypothetical protein
MAGRQHLNRLEAVVLDAAVGVIEDYLPEDAHDARDAVTHARRDVVARADATFKTTALVGAMARIIAAQDERIARLEATLPREKRSKATTKK